MISSRTSGLIQSVKPYVSTGLKEIDDFGSNTAITDSKEAVKDPNSSRAIPDIPTTEAPYDGLVAFGVFLIDASLDG